MPLTLKWQYPTCSYTAWTLHQPTQTSHQELQSLSLFSDSDREPQASEAAAWPQVVRPGSLQAPNWLFQSARSITRLAAVSEKLTLNQEMSHNL